MFTAYAAHDDPAERERINDALNTAIEDMTDIGIHLSTTPTPGGTYRTSDDRLAITVRLGPAVRGVLPVGLTLFGDAAQLRAVRDALTAGLVKLGADPAPLPPRACGESWVARRRRAEALPADESNLARA